MVVKEMAENKIKLKDEGLSSIMASNVFNIDLSIVMEDVIPNISNLINERSLEEDYIAYSSILDSLNDEQAFNYLEKNIELNEIINSNESFSKDTEVLNYLDKMKNLRRNILNNHDLIKIHEEEDESAFHYYLLNEYLFSSLEYDFIMEHIIYTELIDGKPINAVKEEINNLSNFNKIWKFIGLAIDPDEDLFDEEDFREF